MPVVRYFFVMGLCLLGLIMAAGYYLPSAQVVAVQSEPSAGSDANGSLASWRQSQQRLVKPQRTAVVYGDAAPSPPTPERLQWERQLTSPALKPVVAEATDKPAGDKPAADKPAYEARAEMTPVKEASVKEASSPAPVKRVAKIRHPKVIAKVERRNSQNFAFNSAPPPPSGFGGYRQEQYERPVSAFFNFRMF